jgi:hypothetical protein
VYVAKIKGEPRAQGEIERLAWVGKKEVDSHAYRLLPVEEEEILPDVIAHGLLDVKS